MLVNLFKQQEPPQTTAVLKAPLQPQLQKLLCKDQEIINTVN
jgi:hypothetical protein